jgi:hypothetical protein
MDIPSFVIEVVEGGHPTLRDAVSSLFDTKDPEHSWLSPDPKLPVWLRPSKSD